VQPSRLTDIRSIPKRTMFRVRARQSVMSWSNDGAMARARSKQATCSQSATIGVIDARRGFVSSELGRCVNGMTGGLSNPSDKVGNFVNEGRVIEENDALAVQDKVATDHRMMINANLALLHRLLSIIEARSGDESAVITLGVRVFNSSAAALYLTRSGYYQPALMLVRDLIEVADLLDYFLHDKGAIEQWRKLLGREHWRKFSPSSIRNALNKRDMLDRDVRKEYYSMLSEAGTHASLRGVNLLMKDGKVRVGPFSDQKVNQAVFSLLPLAVSFATQIFMRHFEGIEDDSLNHIIVGYNQIFLAWQRRHLSAAVFRLDG